MTEDISRRFAEELKTASDEKADLDATRRAIQGEIRNAIEKLEPTLQALAHEYFSRVPEDTSFSVHIGPEYKITLRFVRGGYSKELSEIAEFDPRNYGFGKSPQFDPTLWERAQRVEITGGYSSKKASRDDFVQTASKYLYLQRSTGRLYGEESGNSFQPVESLVEEQLLSLLKYRLAT